MAISKIKVGNDTHDIHSPYNLTLNGNKEALGTYNGSTNVNVDITLENIQAFTPEDEVTLASGFTNQLPIAQSASSTAIYNGIGYKIGTRWSSSGGGEKADSGYAITGYIPCTTGQTFSIKNIDTDCQYPYILKFNSSKALVGQADSESLPRSYSGIYSHTISTSGVSYIRLVAKTFDSTSVIAVNEEIKETGTIKTGWLKEGDEKISPSILASSIIDENGNLYREEINTALDSKVDKVSGKGLSTNDYTTAEKTKLAGIPADAQPNQNAFSKVTVGSATIEAENTTDTLTLVAGANVTITPDATNDKITITATDTTYSDFVKSGSEAKSGLVPAPSTTAGTSKYLREDGTWVTPPNTTYSDMKGATASAAGTHGLVPAPGVGEQSEFLRGDGTWAVPTDTNTHYTTGITAGASGSTSNSATSNPYIKIKDDSTHRGQIQITGSGATTVKSDANGVITITSTDTNTDTKVTAVGNHYTPSADANSALSADAASTTAATWGNTDLVTGVNIQRDAKGHVTGITVDSIQMPSNPNTDTHWTSNLITGASTTAKSNAAVTTNGNVYLNLVENDTVRNFHNIVGSGNVTVTSDANGKITIKGTDNDTKNTAGSTDSSSKLYLIGATEQAANPQTYSHETAYVGTDGCLYSGSKKVATEEYVSSTFSTAMVFKGTLGTGGTITSLPTASADTVGDTYKVITAGTYASIAAKVGDVFICNSASPPAWVLVPSGDEPSGTVTNVATGAGLTGGSITTSGTIKANLNSETKATVASTYTKGTDANRLYSVQLDTNGKLAVNVPWTDTDTKYTSLPNPYSLTIKGNGTTLTNGTYDGSAAKTVNITPASIGAATQADLYNVEDIIGQVFDGTLPVPLAENISGTLGLEHGGTNSSTSLVSAPIGSFIVKRKTDTGVEYLGSRETVSLDDGDGQISGILGAVNGGTGNNITSYPDGAILCKQTASGGEAFVDYYSSPLSISIGGTGADNRMNAINNLMSLPYNTEPAADTPEEWAKLGSFICYYSSGTSVINKPSTYGTLIQIVAPGTGGALTATTVQQTWMRQGYGYVWTRGGSTTGWSGSADISGADAWKRSYDSSSTIPIANGGTGATSASSARTNLGFTYATSAPSSEPSTGAGAVCFVVDNGDPVPIAEGGTGASSKVNAVKNLGMYPVGSVYITNTSTSPASYLGGTWECFDKELKGKVWDSTSTSGFWTYNSTNTESDSQVYAYVEGHKIHMRFDIHTKVEMGESSYNLGTLNYETMGFGTLPYSAIYAAAVSDGGNVVGYCRLDYSSGVLQIVDVNPKADGNTMAAGSWLYLILEMPITTAAMYNAAVDRFYWKRTA